MPNDDNIIGVLLMVKNEEKSIETTINSTKKLIKNIIVFDTGSTDKTIEIIKNTCINNEQNLYLKEGDFKSYPESRNEAIKFAETIDVNFLILMDAGDILQTNKNKKQFLKIIKAVPSHYNFGLVQKQWLEKTGLDNHFDIRFIKNHKNLRYDLRYPVHECFKDVEEYVNIGDVFILFQDRTKFASSSEKRYSKDIEILSKAPENKRNLYYLAQSYMSVNDFYNGFKYNIKSYEIDDNIMNSNKDFDEKFTLVRIGYCAIACKMKSDIILYYLNKACETKEPPVDAFVYILKYFMDNKCPEKALPYVKKLFDLKKPGSDKSTLVNNQFYDYLRWHLISVICLSTNQMLDIGKNACLKAIDAGNHPNDINNIKLFQT